MLGRCSLAALWGASRSRQFVEIGPADRLESAYPRTTPFERRRSLMELRGGKVCELVLTSPEAPPAVLFLLAGAVPLGAIEGPHCPVDVRDLDRNGDWAVRFVDGAVEVPNGIDSGGALAVLVHSETETAPRPLASGRPPERATEPERG
jgi:hypothetical protein